MQVRKKTFTRGPRGMAALGLTIAVSSACAPSLVRAPLPPEATALPERRATRDSAYVDVRVRLAAAYLESGRARESSELLEAVLSDQDRAPAVASYYLGVAYETLGHLGHARYWYRRYHARGTSSDLKRRVRGRLVLLDRRELERAVRAALEQEAALAATPPGERVVGVFPFVTTTDDALGPLGLALAELLATDLSQTDRLTIVERARIQYLLDEIGLAEDGWVDDQTAARTGRILGAGRIVQGRLDGGEEAVRIQALIAAVGAPRDTSGAPIMQHGAIRELFAMQKTLALALYRELGVQLTTAERERVVRHHTESMDALVHFGFGLESQYGGRYAEAAEHFQTAMAADARFAEANAALTRALEASATQAESLAELVRAGESENGSR